MENKGRQTGGRGEKRKVEVQDRADVLVLPEAEKVGNMNAIYILVTRVNTWSISGVTLINAAI